MSDGSLCGRIGFTTHRPFPQQHTSVQGRIRDIKAAMHITETTRPINVKIGITTKRPMNVRRLYFRTYLPHGLSVKSNSNLEKPVSVVRKNTPASSVRPSRNTKDNGLNFVQLLLAETMKETKKP